MIISKDAAAQLERIFDGLFYGGRLLKSVMGKSLVAMINLVSAVLKLFGTDVLEVAACIGDYITIFGKWVDEHTPFIGMMNKVAKVIYVLIDDIRRCVKAFLGLDVVSDFINKIGDALGNFFGKFGEGFDGLSIDNFIKKIEAVFDKIEAWIKGIDKAENIGQYIIDGLVKGLTTGVKKVADLIKTIATTIIETFCAILGIESPSKIFIALGIFIVDGLILGLVQSQTGIFTTLKDIAIKCYETVKGWFSKMANGTVDFGTSMIEAIKKGLTKVVAFLKGVDWGSIIATGFGVGMLILAYKMVNVFEKLVSPLEAITGMFKSIKTFFNDLGTSLTKYFKAAAFEKTSSALLNMAIAIGILAASVYVLSKVDSDDLWEAVGAVAALAGIVAALAGLSVLLNKIGNGFGGEALSLLAMAGSLLILSFAMQKLATIEADKVNSTLKLLGGMVLGMAALMATFGIFCNTEAASDMHKAGKMLFKMAAAMLVMVLVIKLSSMMDKADINKGLSVVTAVGLLFGAIIMVSKFAGKYASKAGTMLLKMSIAFFAMIGVVKMASMLDRSTVMKGIGVITLVGGLFTALIAVSHLAGENATKAGTMLLTASLALMLVVFAIERLGKMDSSVMKKGLTAITLIGLVFGALIAVSKMASEHSAKAGAMLLQMSGALLIMTGVMFLLSKFDDRGLIKSLSVMTIMTTLMGGLIWVSQYAKDVQKGPLITLVASIAVLTLAVYALSLIEPDRLYPAVTGLSVLLVAFGLLVASTKFAGKIKIGQLMPLLAIIIALSGIVAVLSFLDAGNAIKNAAAVSMLMLTLSGSLFIMGKASRILPTVSKQLLPMLGVVAALALIIGFLSMIDPTSVMTSTAALTILMLSFTGALVVMGKANRILPTVSKQMLPMLGVVAGLALIVAGLSMIPNPDTALKMTGALVTLLLAFTAVTVVLSTIGKGNVVTSAAKGGAALSAVVGIVTGLVLVIGGLIGLMDDSWISTIDSGLDRFIDVMQKMAPMLLAFIPVTAALAAIGAFLGTGAAANGALALSAVVGILGAVALAIGSLMSLFTDDFFSEIETGLDRFTSIMIKLGEAIGGFVGGIIGGIAEGALAAIGNGLSAFMNNAQDFIEGCRKIDSSVVAGAGMLAGAIIAMSISDLIFGIVDLVSIGSSLPTLGNELSAFMNNAEDFINGASGLDPAMMEGVKTLAGAILILTGANLLDGLARFFSFGTSSLSSFGEQLPILGLGISDFASNLSGFEGKGELVAQAAEAIKVLAQAASEIPNVGGLLASIVGDNDLGTWASQLPNVGLGISGFISNLGEFDASKVEVARAAADVIKILAEAAMNIPNMGGWLAAIVGDNDLATWSVQLPLVAAGITGFITNLGEFDDSNVETAKAAAEVIKILAQASSEIPNVGGWLAAIVGDNDLSTWASQLPNVGTGISGFLTNLGEFDENKVATAKCAAEVIKVLAQASQSIDGQADWAKKIFGDNSISTFSDQFGTLGTNIAAFVENLGTFSEDQVKTAQQAVAAVRAFATLADANLSGAKKNLEGFGDKLPGLGTNIADFCENVPAADKIKTAVDNVKKVIGAIKDICSVDAGAFKDFVTALGESGEKGVNAFVKAFTSDTAKTDVKDAAKKLVDQAIDGVESKETDVKDAFKAVAEAGVSAVKSKTNFNKFEGAGKYLVQGFASGITKNTFTAEAKAAAMAKKAAEAAMEALDINSPSKVFMAIGSSVPEGFAMGIEMLGSLVGKSTNTMGQTAIDGVNRAVANIASVIDTDIDSEPTIRPVLDLSDVEYGVSAMNGMFTNQSVGVLANVNGISTMMNGRRQNGTNTDIISAIDKFRDDFKHSDRTTYQINGITYDDGSNLRDAIETIIRYANIERRV